MKNSILDVTIRLRNESGGDDDIYLVKANGDVVLHDDPDDPITHHSLDRNELVFIERVSNAIELCNRNL